MCAPAHEVGTYGGSGVLAGVPSTSDIKRRCKVTWFLRGPAGVLPARVEHRRTLVAVLA